MPNPVLLSESDVRAVLPMTDLIAAMEGALAQFSAGAVTQPVRTVLEVGADRAYFGVMPASQRPVARVLAPALQPADSVRAATLRAATSARTRRSAFLRLAW